MALELEGEQYDTVIVFYYYWYSKVCPTHQSMAIIMMVLVD